MTVTPAVITVEPGQEATCEIRIVNTGTIVDGYQIEFSQEVADWVAVTPRVLHVFPGKEETARVAFRPPRTHMVAAGPRPFSVRVRSILTEEGRIFEQHCHITIGSFTAVEATIAPKTSEAVGHGVHTLMMANQGNTPAKVRLRGFDADEKLTFELEPDEHIIEPGGSVASRLRVSRRPGVSRPEHRFPFQVEVAVGDEPPIRLDVGLVQQRPPIVSRRPWQPWAIASAAVGLLVIVGAMYAANPNFVARGPLTPINPGRPSSVLSATITPQPSSATSAPSAPPTPAHSQPPTPAPPPPTSRAGANWSGWVALPSGGTTNVAASAVAYNGKLYMFGIGTNDHGHYLNVFDGSNWSGWAQMARGLSSTVSDTAVVYNGKIYVFGIGMYDQHHYVDVFDGASWNGWNQVPGGGTSTLGDTAVAFNGKLYLFGIGINDHEQYMDRFDGSNWSGWAAVPGSAPTGHSDAAVVYNGSLYLFSVIGSAHSMNVLNGSSWSGATAVAGGGTTNQSEAAAVFNGKLYLFGIGINDRGEYASVFDGTSWSGWSVLPGGASSRSYDTATAFNDKLYLVTIGIDQRYYIDVLSS